MYEGWFARGCGWGWGPTTRDVLACTAMSHAKFCAVCSWRHVQVRGDAKGGLAHIYMWGSGPTHTGPMTPKQQLTLPYVLTLRVGGVAAAGRWWGYHPFLLRPVGE